MAITQNGTQTTAEFSKSLGRLYGIYTGAFLAFIIFIAIIDVATRTAQVSEYYVAGRRVPAFYNGMATGADWMSAASFVGMAGSLFLLGYDGLAWVLGWTGGFVLVSILVGPYLRKFGAYTVPDFLAFRYLRHRPHRFTLPGHAVRDSRLRRSRRHLALCDAGRHAGGDLDADRTIHRADHCVPHPDHHPVHQEVRNTSS
jgi:hypothetical protein